MRRELVLVYAWNPAVIKELTGSGHPDGLMMLALVAGVYLLARGRAATGGALLALSVLAKLATARRVCVKPALGRRGSSIRQTVMV